MKCKVDGFLGEVIIRRKVVGSICGYIKCNNESECGAPVDHSCKHKQQPKETK